MIKTNNRQHTIPSHRGVRFLLPTCRVVVVLLSVLFVGLTIAQATLRFVCFSCLQSAEVIDMFQQV